MHLEIDIKQLLESNKLDELRIKLPTIPVPDLAEQVDSLEPEERKVFFDLMPLDIAKQVFEYLPPPMQKITIQQLEHQEAAQILNEMAPDDRTAFLEELPGPALKKLIQLLSEDERKVTLALLGYPAQSVGRLMTPDYITVRPWFTIADAFKKIRDNGPNSETLDAVYVTDDTGVLLDDLRISQLLLAEPDKKISDLMDNVYLSLKVDQDQEEAVKKFSKYHRLALPVTDKSNVLLGIVTVDDMLHISKEEDTEDMHKIGGVEAFDEPYLQMPIYRMISKRAVWLVILFFSELLTATAMGFFEDEIAKAVVLALFVPLIISSGGNSGSQATTLIIRAMALGEVRLRDWWRVMSREIQSGLMLGLLLGSIGFLRIYAWTLFSDIYGPHWFLLAVTVGCSLVGVVMWGSLTGSMLPFILRRCGLDPATSSAPFVATLVDVTGLIIYFSVGYFFLTGTLL